MRGDIDVLDGRSEQFFFSWHDRFPVYRGAVWRARRARLICRGFAVKLRGFAGPSRYIPPHPPLYPAPPLKTRHLQLGIYQYNSHIAHYKRVILWYIPNTRKFKLQLDFVLSSARQVLAKGLLPARSRSAALLLLL